jgi:hypothetical protein
MGERRMSEERLKEWQVPAQAAKLDKKLGWLNESTEEGQLWLKSQRGFDDYRKAMDILGGKISGDKLLDYRSIVSTNRLKRNVREIVGALANIRPIWGFHTDNDAFSSHANMMNKVSRAIYLEQYFDRSLKEVLQYAAATCTGFARPVYRRGMGGRGRGNIQLMTYGSPCVVPNQMPTSNDWQEAYVVHLLDEMPIYMAHSLFPDFQEQLHPTASKYWYSPDVRTAAKGNMWKRLFSGNFMRKGDNELSDLYIPIRYSTIIDLTINRTGKMIPMGELDTPWYYEVPSFGEDINIGSDREGRPIYKKATLDDARLYPFRRLMISSENVIMYDGPAFNWHGELDLIPFCVDDWPWEAIGFSLIHDGYDIQMAINEIDRGMMDKVKAQLDLPLAYDINAVNYQQAKSFDPMQPRARIGFDGGMVDQPFKPVVPPEVYKIGPEVLEVRGMFKEDMDYQLALRDIVELAKARAIGKSSDQLEALMVASGPIIRDISRSMERSLSRIGSQMKYLILEYETTHRLMQYVGEDGMSQEVYDYDPTTIVPSHLPGESTVDANQQPIGSPTTRVNRARWFADNLRFYLLPHSVHEITQVVHQLMLLQLKQRGAPIDWRTIMEACNVPNVGTKPDGNTVQERFWNEKEEEILHMIRMQKLAESMGVDPSALSGGQGKGGGRPPTAQAAPQQYKKGDGRTGIKES